MKKTYITYGGAVLVFLGTVMAAGAVLNYDLPHGYDVGQAVQQLRNARTVYDVAYANASNYSMNKMGCDSTYQQLMRKYNNTDEFSEEHLIIGDSLNNYANKLFNKHMHECPELAQAEQALHDARITLESAQKSRNQADSLASIPFKKRFKNNWNKIVADIKSR